MQIPGLALAILIGVSLGFFGGGGSILTVPLLVYVFGLDAKQAIASSLLIVGIASLSAALQHWRAGNLRLKTGAVFGCAGAAGACAGGRAGAYLDGGVLLLLFASMMVMTAAAMWRGRRALPKRAKTPRATGKLVRQGLAVGMFTGLVGAGGGFLIVPALTLWAGLPMQAAVGTSLAVIVMNSLGGFVGYSTHVSVSYGLIGSVSAAAVAGSFAGSRFAHAVDPNSLRRAFAGFVLAMAAMILVREGQSVAQAAQEALPRSLPQALFALAMLAIGLWAGRTSRPSATAAFPDASFEEGEGI